MCISDFGDGDGDGGGDGGGGGGGGGGGSSPEAQFNKILHLNGTLFTQPTTLLLCRGTRSHPPSSFLLPTTRFRTRRHFLRLLSSVSPVPVSFPAVIPPTNRYQMGKIELVRATLVIIAWPPVSTILPWSYYWSYRCLALTTSVRLTAHVRDRRTGNSSNFSYVNFMQNFPALVVVYIVLSLPLSFFLPLSLSFFLSMFSLCFFVFLSAKCICK